MKTSIRTVITAAAIISASLISWSCMKNDGPYYDMSIYYPNAVVTVKPLDDKGSSFYMQLDDNTTLKPLNITASPYKEKEVRAFVNYRVIEDGDAGDYDQAVNIIWIDSLRTKTMAPDLGDRNETEYGSDPVEIIKGFPTVVEDGYIVEALDRSTLRAAQTPQVFETDLILACMKQAFAQGFTGTDDCSLVLRFSKEKICVVEGSYENIKITTREDLKAG